MAGGKMKKTEVKIVDLDKIPNGRRKPVRTAVFIEKMRKWREQSARSQLVI